MNFVTKLLHSQEMLSTEGVQKVPCSHYSAKCSSSNPIAVSLFFNTIPKNIHAFLPNTHIL